MDISVCWVLIAASLGFGRLCRPAMSMQMTTLLYHKQRATWNDAIVACDSTGHRLLDLHNVPIQYALQELSRRFIFDYNIWIGLHNQGGTDSDDFRWSDCDRLLPQNANWASSPQDSSATDYCVSADKGTFHWHLQDCASHFQHYVCYKREGSCTYEMRNNSTCGTAALSKHYQVEAEAQCRQKCEVEVNDGGLCWAYQYKMLHQTCTLFFDKSPYSCDVTFDDKTTLAIRRCFSFKEVFESGVLLKSYKDVKPLVSCPVAQSTHTPPTSLGSSYVNSRTTASFSTAWYMNDVLSRTLTYTSEASEPSPSLSPTVTLDMSSVDQQVSSAMTFSSIENDISTNDAMITWTSSGSLETEALFLTSQFLTSVPIAGSLGKEDTSVADSSEYVQEVGATKISFSKSFIPRTTSIQSITAKHSVETEASAVLTRLSSTGHLSQLPTQSTRPVYSPSDQMTSRHLLFSNCYCGCQRNETVDPKVDYVKDLQMKKYSCGLFQRRLNSSQDSRVSATAIGTLGMIFIVFIPIATAIADILTVWKTVKS